MRRGIDRRGSRQPKAGGHDKHRPSAGEFDDLGDEVGNHAALDLSTFTKILSGSYTNCR
jgi:hypothetical protein